MDQDNNVGMKIRDMRKRLKLTQAELAGKDFTKSFISQIEKGQTNPSLKSLQVIARRLGIPIGFLLGQDSPKDNQQDYLIFLEQARRAKSDGKIQDAIRFTRKALEACQASDHTVIGFTQLCLAELLLDHGPKSSALEQLELAVEHLQMSHDYYNLARAWNLLGHLHEMEQRFGEALKAFLNGLELVQSERAKDSHLLLSLMVNVGITQGQLGHFEQSIESLESATQLMNEQDSFYNFGRVCHTLGYVYSKTNRLRQAIDFTERAISIYRTFGNSELECSAKINLAIYARMDGDVKRSHELLNEIIGNEKANNPRQLSRAYAEHAYLDLAEGNIEKAVKHMSKAFSTDPTHDQIPEWMEIAVAAVGDKSFTQEILVTIETLAEKWKGPAKGRAAIHSALGELYTKLGDPELANRHLRQSVEIYQKNQP